MMKRMPWTTMLSGVVLGAAVWLSAAAQQESSAVERLSSATGQAPGAAAADAAVADAGGDSADGADRANIVGLAEVVDRPGAAFGADTTQAEETADLVRVSDTATADLTHAAAASEGTIAAQYSPPASGAEYTPRPNDAPSPSGSTSLSSNADPTVRAFSYPLVAVNGVSLDDDLETILKTKGKPNSIKPDELFSSTKLYKFNDCDIEISDGEIQYVSVPAAAGKIELDGHRLPMDLNVLKSRLGEPFFEAEDGIVYKVRQNALKLYIDPDSGKLTSIHFFPAMHE
ncbi:hypothetical protein [Paenibacillus xerothermodurans]|uniref:DUF4309 domain-containing protein n=1 Tax=Paenibacillus xerothermodurans TaxID=1977292 RepID=A0A2W1N999_PAEXE|nr:hypothetical protein [Paenibacillus xerothermodurans]PZE20240.1 hypothetical protein CBW46_013900 [Paenibacillus xerothermodurans]